MHKEIRNTVVWLFFAFFVLATAIWQAQLSAAKDLAEKQRTLPPPRKTKHAVRPAPKEFTGDVVADYVARCGKGMTDQEIDWVLEDFENAGLDFDWKRPGTIDEQLVSLRAAQQRWYHQALEDGLRLSPEQSTQAARKLSELFVEATKTFLAGKQRLPVIMKGAAPGERSSSYAYPSNWLYDLDAGFMPWMLCQLTPPQQSLTWKYRIEKLKNDLPDPEKLAESTRGPVFLTGGPTGGFSNFIPPGFLIPVVLPNAVLPILASQRLSEAPDSFAEPGPQDEEMMLKDIHRLHPAQFKLLLLFDPEMAGKIQSALDREHP